MRKNKTPYIPHTPRKMSRRRMLSAALTGSMAVGAGFAATQQAAAQTTMTLKMQSTWPTKDIFHEVFVDWGKKVEEMAGGRLKIDILPSGAVVPAFQLIEAVQERSVLLSGPPPASTPAAFRRPDGTSQFTPEFGAVYTSRAVLDAEARLLDASRSLTGPRGDPDRVDGDAHLARARLGRGELDAGERLPLLPGAEGHRVHGRIVVATALRWSGAVAGDRVAPPAAPRSRSRSWSPRWRPGRHRMTGRYIPAAVRDAVWRRDDARRDTHAEIR